MAREDRAFTEHGKPHRLMAVWTATHDNGWLTSVVENPDGSFAAWAAPDGEDAGMYTIQADVEGGKSAAELALKRHTAHHDCSEACSAWQVRRYAVFDRRPTESRAAVRAAVDARRVAAKRGAAA